MTTSLLGAGSSGPAPQWLWSDAWVLAAIMMTAGADGAELRDLVAAADAINHAILMAEEIEPAVRRLLGAGLIEVRDRRFRLTDQGRELAATRHGDLLGQVDRLLGALDQFPIDERPWSLEPGALDRAVRDAAS